MNQMTLWDAPEDRPGRPVHNPQPMSEGPHSATLDEDSLYALYSDALSEPHPQATHYHVTREMYGMLMRESGALTWDEARQRAGRMLGHAAVFGCRNSSCERADESQRQ